LDLKGEKGQECIKLRNEQLHNLYCLSNFGMIKLRRMSCVGHLTYRGEERRSYEVFVGKPEVNKPLLGVGRDMRIILRYLSMKWIGRI